MTEITTRIKEEIQEEMKELYGVEVSIETIDNWLQHYHYERIEDDPDYDGEFIFDTTEREDFYYEITNSLDEDTFPNYLDQFYDDFPFLDYDSIVKLIESKGYKIEGEYYDGGFDINNGDYFIGILDDHMVVIKPGGIEEIINF